MASDTSAVPTRTVEASEHAVAPQPAPAATGAGRNLFLDEEGSGQPSEPAAADTDRADARTVIGPDRGHEPPALLVPTGEVCDTAKRTRA